jgi:hypothetical protein
MTPAAKRIRQQVRLAVWKEGRLKEAEVWYSNKQAEINLVGWLHHLHIKAAQKEQIKIDMGRIMNSLGILR